MSDRMSVGQARAWIENGWDVNHHYLARGAFRTVVAQAEQIGRLQAALRKAEVARREAWVEYGADIDPHGKIHWDAQYPDLLPGDMEAPK